MSNLPQSSVKYTIKATIESKGVVEKPDVIGAIFGQTEGLLGPNMDLRQLQIQGKVGRIDVEVHDYDGESEAHIEMPSSLDSAETAILAASLETIDRVGPCISDVTVDKVEDVRVSKRNYIVDRAKEILDNMVKDAPSPEDLSRAVRKKMNTNIQTYYGLYAGPEAKDDSDIILVEGRSDVLNLLNYGYDNAVAIGGTSVPEEISKICDEHKKVVAFLDGDRGGDLIEKELYQKAGIDSIARAPEGKEVEDLNEKLVEKCLEDSERFKPSDESVPDLVKERSGSEESDINLGSDKEVSKESKVEVDEDERLDVEGGVSDSERLEGSVCEEDSLDSFERSEEDSKVEGGKTVNVPNELRRVFKTLLNDLVGTRAACVLDEGMNELKRLPVSRLGSWLRGKGDDAFAVVFDGTIDESLCEAAEDASLEYIVGMKGEQQSSKVNCIRRFDI